jgi:hypothetical protein
MIAFGVGKLIAVPTNDFLGAAVANPTPVVLGTMQDITLDLSVELKTLYGSRRYPIAVGQGKGKTELKAKYADIDGGVLGSLFLGKSGTTGIKAGVFDAISTIPATPFQITIAPPNSGTFVTDLGVTFVATGTQLTRVASAPAAGQYSLNATTGVYTFNTADTGKQVAISYEYSAAAGGAFWNMTNELMGYTPSFTVLLQNEYDGKKLVVKLNRCVSGKLNVPLKNDDFAISDFEAEAFADSAGSLGYICMF